MSSGPDIISKDDEPKDSAPYIRTYAQDYAALSSNEPAKKKGHHKTEAPVPPAIPQPPRIKPTSLQDEFRNSTYSDSLITKDDSTVESLNLDDIGGNVDSINAFSSKNTEARSGELNNSASIVSPSQPIDAEREAILTRLKNKVKSQEPVVASQEPIVEKIERAPVIPEPVETVPKAPEPFHSYSTDFADRIDEQQASKFSVLAAEKDAPQKKVRQTKRSNALPIIAGVILIAIGVGAISYTFMYMSKAAPAVIAPPVSTLVSSSEFIPVSGSGSQLMQALVQNAPVSLPENSIDIYTLESYSTSSPSNESSGAILGALNVPAPSIFLRNVAPDSNVGVVHAGTETRTFFVLDVESYERTFAGMLQWEPTMPKDLALLYPAYPEVPLPAANASSTETTTTHAVQPVAAGDFVDEIVSNHNVRAYKDASGRTVLLYGYADQKTLIIARNEAAFSLILTHLTNQS